MSLGVSGASVRVFRNRLAGFAIDEIRERPEDFTRRGKIGPLNAVLQVLTSERQSMEGEILDMMKRTEMPKVSVTAMFRARGKIRLKFLQSLLKESIAAFQKRNRMMMRTYDGYRLIAIDGSKVQLPHSLDRKDAVTNIPSGIYCLSDYLIEFQEAYDVINNIIMDFQISAKCNEYAMAIANVRNVESIEKSPKIYVFDRGYTSLRLEREIIKAHSFFVIRIRNCDFLEGKKLLGERSGDVEFIREFNRYNTNEYRSDIRFRMELFAHPMRLRLVRFEVGDGTVETLVTNLTKERMTLDKLKEIYNLRWGVETDYRNAKQRHAIDVFSGRKLKGVLQDIYASEIMHALTLMTVWEASFDAKLEGHRHRMKINYASAARKLRKSYILDTLAAEADDFEKILSHLMDEIPKDLVPIRPGRKGRDRRCCGTSNSDTYKK